MKTNYLSLGEIKDGGKYTAIQFGTVYTASGPIWGAVTGRISGLSADDARAQIKNAINQGHSVVIFQD